jgi:Putative glycosyl hydrolase domain
MAISRMKRSWSLWLLLAPAFAAGVPGVARAESSAVAVVPAVVPAASPVVAPPAASPFLPPNLPAPSRSEQDLAVRGIYLQQLTVQRPKRLEQLIDRALKTGINTFVVDVWGRTPAYARAIETIHEAGLSYVPRVAIFPGGASPEQMSDHELLEQRWSLIDYALSLGAKDVQLDYIRFSAKNADSPENASKVLEVIRFFRERIEQRGARLQIDIFGEVAYAPSTHIGQDIRRFAPALDAVCPMLYPSHFEPHEQTAKAPYQTVHGALTALDRQIQDKPIPVYAYIEPFNYRHEMSDEERGLYLEAQLQAVLDSHAQGFYVWSAGNYYDIVFKLLQRRAHDRSSKERAEKAAMSASNAPRALTAPAPSPRPAVVSSRVD